MRKVFILALVSAASWGGVANADQAGWCAAYARDFADARATDKVLWQHKYDIAQKSCLDKEQLATPVVDEKKVDVPKADVAKTAASATQIPKPLSKAAATPAAEDTVADTPVAVEPAMPKHKLASAAPDVGTPEWNAYCAKKYTSFNAVTGTYKSLTGVDRKCLYTG
jgi:hypothetical protein